MMNKGKLKTFTIDFTSEMDGETYQGAFTAKKLSILDQAKVNRRKSELCGGMYTVRDEEDKPTGQGIDEMTDYMNYMIALLEVSLVSYPPWWNMSELFDERLLGAVFKEVMAFENSFRRRTGEDGGSQVSDGSSQEGGDRKLEKSVSANDPQKVVDKEVSAALDA